ncbi:MAG TPA: type I 3-dehydroquinate dehydratase [Thermoanaerobaculia bacterium]|nr:type I 3-dehydroquinate dehydratase [Thermoanaerobaculia bacterium]
MKLFVTVAEPRPEEAVEAIRNLRADHDGVEVRVEHFAAFDPAAFRAATRRPIILTRRGMPQTPGAVRSAIEAGIDFVDVEWGGDLGWLAPFRSQVVLSHHDFERMPDASGILASMRGFRCAHTKLAVTPRTLAENLALLAEQQPGTTLIGMGERGLYSRILAPFLGSELTFVSRPGDRAAAPGQIALDRALAIYGEDRGSLQSKRVFAIAGNPAGHSLSPVIHNPLFRAKKVPAAYTIASVDGFDEIATALLDGTLSGVSVTAPFKQEALAFARSRGAAIGENARAAGSVNTIVAMAGSLVADNTDVDGFSQIVARLCGRDRKTVALIGAGGTARAALVALQRAGMRVIVYNRTEERGRALAAEAGVAFEPLTALRDFDGEIVIDTITGSERVDLPLRPGMTYIEAGYGYDRGPRPEGVEWIDGLDLLQAQAIRQHELFMKVFDGS